MGREKGSRLVYFRRASGGTDAKTKDTRVSDLWNRWKEKGMRVRSEQMLKVSPAYDILKQTTLAAKEYQCYTEDRYSNSPPPKRHMRNADLIRSQCMLHAVAAIREIMERAVEGDMPDVLDRALEAASAIKSCLLERNFFLIPKKPEGEAVVKIKRIEPDEEDAKILAGYSLQATSQKYNVIINTLAEAARKVNVRLLSVEEMKEGIPPTPVMDLVVSAVN